MADIGPEFVGLHKLHLLWFGRSHSPALDLLQNPVHHRIVAHSDQSLRRPQPHPFQIVRQGRRPFLRLHSPMILFPARFSATPAQPTLPTMPTRSVFDQGCSSAMDAIHPAVCLNSHWMSIPNEQSPRLHPAKTVRIVLTRKHYFY